MTTRGMVEFPPVWPTVTSVASLPNVAGSPTQLSYLEIGDWCYCNAADVVGWFYCRVATFGATKWTYIPTGFTQTIAATVAVSPGAGLLLVTGNANITLPKPVEGYTIDIKKATASALSAVNLLQHGTEKIELVAATYALTVFNGTTLPSVALRSDGTDWYIR